MPNLEDDILILDDDLTKIKQKLTGQEKALEVVSITGMGGIGKTTLARQAYEHPEIKGHFDIHAWVITSQEFQRRDVLLTALRCISEKKKIIFRKSDDKKGNDKQDESFDLSKENEQGDHQLIDSISEESDLADLLQKTLKCGRYLVVVDDIWSEDDWDNLKGIFPDSNNGSRVLLTTRNKEVAMFANPTSPHEMNPLNEENSWSLLRDKVFGPEHYPDPELEKVGLQIAKKTQGLPLTISLIAGHLSNIPRTLKSWKDVARSMSKIVSTGQDNCLGVLGLSYHYLPKCLKHCFLSMGAFPEDFEVEAWRLIQLWMAEDFIEPEELKSLEEVAKGHLEGLISRNLIMVRKRKLTGSIKACGVHDLLHEFCIREAKKTKFMHPVRSLSDASIETSTPGVHRFSFRFKTYLHECLKLSPSRAKSFYFFGEVIISPSPSPKSDIFSCLKLLRVLAIFRHELSSFPIEITNLVHLRYLAVSSKENLPAAISKLQHLQTLIYKQKNYFEKTIYLPRDLWKMTNLKHIRLNERSNLSSLVSTIRFERRNDDLMLGMPNLEEFSTLCFSSCTNEVFSGIPNLKRLSIGQTSHEAFLDSLIDLSCLCKLEALKCAFYKIPYSRGSISIRRLVFPACLNRLTLSGPYLPWDDLSSLVKLPNLEVLKLKKCERDNQVWSLNDDEKFDELKFLVIGNTKLKRWEASCDSFPKLQSLVLKNCTELENVPEDFVDCSSLELIELHNCNTSVDESAKKIAQEREEIQGNDSLKVHIN
ncbi:hypothetical protein HAX54_015343 [Datura stramonium]|uniref:NB-ARC domain-containing protein n=1 Tax=Datura stramonium TaxID=4076 RepID=A0ABS8TPN9_DATST|nr:hypothetical protein [Datura stramonium]